MGDVAEQFGDEQRGWPQTENSHTGRSLRLWVRTETHPTEPVRTRACYPALSPGKTCAKTLKLVAAAGMAYSFAYAVRPTGQVMQEIASIRDANQHLSWFLERVEQGADGQGRRADRRPRQVNLAALRAFSLSNIHECI